MQIGKVISAAPLIVLPKSHNCQWNRPFLFSGPPALAAAIIRILIFQSTGTQLPRKGATRGGGVVAAGEMPN